MLRSNERGFTLVELIVVNAIFAVIVGLGIGFYLEALVANARSRVRIDLQQQARFVSDRIVYETRRARGVEPTSDFNDNLADDSDRSFELDMSEATEDPTSFSVLDGVLYMRQGADPSVALTTDRMNVTDFTLQDLSPVSGRSTNVAFTLTLEQPDPSGKDRMMSYSVRTAVEVRGR